MKLLQIIHSMDPEGGGPAELIRQISPVLEEMGHYTEVACLDAPDSPWVKGAALKIKALGPGRGKYGYSSSFLPWVRSNRKRFDAVIVHGSWQYSGFGTREALKGTDTPYFIFPHGMLDPWFNEFYFFKRIKKQLYWPLGEYRVLRDSRAVLFTSQEEMFRSGLSFRPHRCNKELVKFGTSPPPGDGETQSARFMAEFPGARGKKIFLFMGRIHEKKGCDILIEAFARVLGNGHDSCLVMAGPDQKGLIKKYIASTEHFGVRDKVIWTGTLKGDIKWGALRSAEVFILPSHQENFGIAVAEALACGVPVLVSDKVNIWREIQKDGAGFADTDTVRGAQRLLEKWLDLTDGDKAHMREKARKCFFDRFEIHRATESLVEVVSKYL